MKESDIVHQNGKMWVLNTPYGYEVRMDKGMFSAVDSAYSHDAEGLSLAKARADYLASKTGLIQLSRNP